jgi:hypothetical protein
MTARAVLPVPAIPVVCTHCGQVVAAASDTDLAEQLVNVHCCDATTPYEIVDLVHSPTPYQARCRRCIWRSQWYATVDEARAEHDGHWVAAHAEVRAR